MDAIRFKKRCVMFQTEARPKRFPLGFHGFVNRRPKVIDENAEASRERAAQARERMAFNEFFESIMHDINTEADAGNNRTTYTVSKQNRDYIGQAVELLEARDYQVEVNESGSNAVLRISWT